MKILYKGILCNLSTYRVMGEDRPALYPVTQSSDEIFYKELVLVNKWVDKTKRVALERKF